uniref:Myelin basic protein n=1 Tax=Gadus morhua TaxID=8049 RepID=A0A8C5AXT9_GADMO
MATTSSSGLSKKKKNTPGLMDQINTFFGGDKKKRSKGSFRGHLSTSPQGASARRKPNESAVAHFFRSFVSVTALDSSPFLLFFSKAWVFEINAGG